MKKKETQEIEEETKQDKLNRKIREGIVIVVTILLIMIIYKAIGCPFRFFFGISCPGCGMSRAVVCALHGDFHSAMYNHPLFFLAPFLLLLIVFWRRIKQSYRSALATAIIVVFIAVYLYRLVFSDHQIVFIDPPRGIFLQIVKTVLNPLLQRFHVQI